MNAYYLLIIVMTFTASFASFFLKRSTVDGTLLSIIISKYLYIGGCLYIATAFLNILILKQLPYSFVVPLGSLTYIWAMFIGHFFLKEKIGIKKIIGVLLILSGVICSAS